MPVKKEIISLNDHENLINEQLKDVKKSYGMFFTPEWVVKFILEMIDFKQKRLKILDPAFGLGQFLFGIYKNFPKLYERSKLYGVEINKVLLHEVSKLNPACRKIKLFNADFILWKHVENFDLIFGNPPYGIPSSSKHYPIKVTQKVKEQYKKAIGTWFGKYNIYGAFIEKAITLLKEGGQLLFIVPATFLILDEFKKLRTFLADNGKTTVTYMGSDVFKPKASVTCVILNFTKSHKNKNILKLYDFNTIYNVSELNYIEKNWTGLPISFQTELTKQLEEHSSFNLDSLFKINISPRSPEIKSNSFVRKELEQAIKTTLFVPILNGRNLKPNKIIYDKNFSGYWIDKNEICGLRTYFEHPRIVIGHTKGGRVEAGYDKRCFPWMGDVYHLIEKESTPFHFDFGSNKKYLLEYLNSNLLQKYLRQKFKKITPHITASQLKELPVPTKQEFKEILTYWDK